jgi:hypothetical protein
LALFSGLADVDLVLSTDAKKLRLMTYALTDQRAEEITACWSRPALSIDDATYWKVGKERYRLSGTTLEIARTERMQDLVAELKSTLGKTYGAVAELEDRYRVIGVPDWPYAVKLNHSSTVNVANNEEVTNVDMVVSFFGDSSQREHLLQDIEQGTGLAELVRNQDNVPVLRTKRGSVVFETEVFSGTELVLNVRTATTR